MATAAQMLAGLSQPSAGSVQGSTTASGRMARNTGAANSATGQTAQNAMENFAAALRASVSAQPFAGLSPNGEALNTNGLVSGQGPAQGQSIASLLGNLPGATTPDGATPLANALAALPGMALPVDANGNPISIGQIGNSISQWMTGDPTLAGMINGDGTSASTGFENRLTLLSSAMAQFGSGNADMPNQMFGNGLINGSPLSTDQIQALKDALGQAIHLGMGQEASALNLSNLEGQANAALANRPGVAFLLDQADAGNIEIPANARAILENGGSLAEFTAAMRESGTPLNLGSIVSEYVMGRAGEDASIYAPDLLASNPVSLEILPGLTNQNETQPLILDLPQSASHLELAPEVRAALANGEIGQNIAGAVPQGEAAAATPLVPGATDRSGLQNNVGAAVQSAAIAGAATSPGQSSETLAPKAAPVHSSDVMQKAPMGQLIEQVRSGEISPDAARQALSISGRGNLVPTLNSNLTPSLGSSPTGGQPATAATPQTIRLQTQAGNVPAQSGESSVDVKSVPPSQQVQSGPKRGPVFLTPETNSNRGLATGVDAATKAQTPAAMAQQLATDTRTPLETAVSKMQTGDVPNDRPLQAASAQAAIGQVKSAATLIKEGATQFAKSGTNPATAPTTNGTNPTAPSAPTISSQPVMPTNAPTDTALPAAAQMDRDLDVAPQIARSAGEVSFEPRGADRPSSPAPVTSNQPVEAAPTQIRPEVLRDQNADVRSVMRFDTATRVAAVQDMSVALTRFAAQGLSKFQIRLDPQELGRVEVKLSIMADGKTTAHIAVDRPETLDMMRNDSRTLERALQDAGLKTDQNSMTFSLKDQGEGTQRGNDRDGLPDSAQDGKSDEALSDETVQLTPVMEETVAGLRLMGASGIDVRI